MATQLAWRGSGSASCFYAAAALSRGQTLVDTRLAERLAAPNAALTTALESLGLDRARFDDHLTPLAARIGGNRELASAALAKADSRQAAERGADRLTGPLGMLESAFNLCVPNADADLLLRAGPLREQWEARGPGLLAEMARRTHPDLLPANAEVILAHPCGGGGGEAYLPYNLVVFEAVLANPLAELPEVVRLGWLISTLDLDLPRHSEGVPPGELHDLARLAMLPPALEAAVELELARASGGLLSTALKSWIPVSDASSGLADLLQDWWDAAQAPSTRWPVALAALRQMLAEASESDAE